MYILYILGPSAFPVLLFLLSIPSALGVPGVSLFLGFAQASLALQMLTGACVCVCVCVREREREREKERERETEREPPTLSKAQIDISHKNKSRRREAVNAELENLWVRSKPYTLHHKP